MVWQDALYNKLLKLGIGSPFAEMLKNIYNKSSVRIKLREGLTTPLHDNIGIKQGCVLSPTLFKIFVSDISKIFKESCSRVKLYEERINYLMFADDVLLSETPEGLQHALGNVQEYYGHWRLKINTDTTKVMKFNKSGRIAKEKFTLCVDLLENVNSYTYLGLEFVPSGSFKPAMETLCTTASKAMFKQRQSLSKLNLTPKLSLHLYDILIQPICTYAYEVLGSYIETS